MENISLLGRLVLAGRPALARARVPGTTRLLERGLSKAQGRSVVTLPSKVRMDIDFADRVQRAEAFWAYESGELRALGRLVRPGDIVLDLGGHVGYHALHLARAVGRAGKVLTFEPNPANLVQLRRNIALNPELPIQVVAAAAGRAGGTAAFGPVDEPGESGWGSVSPVQEGGTITVPVVSIDEIVRVQNLPRVDLIKMDIQGAERDAIIGAQQVLARYRPTVVCEIVDGCAWQFGYTREMFITEMFARGYEASVFSRSGSRIPLSKRPSSPVLIFTPAEGSN